MMEILIGFISGIVTSIGMGGGTVLILLLTIFLNIPQNIAQATNLIFFIPTSIVSVCLNYKDKNIDFKLGYNIIFWGIIGAIVGASIVNKIEIIFLRKMFGLFLILVALYEIYLLFFNKKK
ncbi:MAG: sulfite exporter TauE/SafE family protein [Clostridiales bacterium]|nr:sulfite exporter TauE/SafE family protein [Clostridiales bacterium]